MMYYKEWRNIPGNRLLSLSFFSFPGRGEFVAVSYWSQKDQGWKQERYEDALYVIGLKPPRYPVPAIPIEFMWFPDDEFGPGFVSYIRDYKFGWDMGGWRQEILA